MADDEKTGKAKGGDALAELVRENVARKNMNRDLKAKVADLEGKLSGYEDLKAKHAELESRLKANPDEKSRRIAELEGELKARDRRADWHKALKSAGVADQHVEDVEKLLGYAPAADDYDQRAYEAALPDLLGRMPNLKGEKPEPSAEGEGARRSNAATGFATPGGRRNPAVERGAAPLPSDHQLPGGSRGPVPYRWAPGGDRGAHPSSRSYGGGGSGSGDGRKPGQLA